MAEVVAGAIYGGIHAGIHVANTMICKLVLPIGMAHALVQDEQEAPSPVAAEKLYQPNFKKFVVDGANFAKPVTIFGLGEEGSDKDISDAVNLYTGNLYYAQMNAALRGDIEKDLEKYGNFIRLIAEAFRFNKLVNCSKWPLQPFVGVVYRGCSLPLAESKKYSMGSHVTWQGFSSTSSQKGTSFGGNVHFEIHSGKAIDAAKKKASGSQSSSESAPSESVYLPASVAHLSQYKRENEVLFPPYTQFCVVNRIEKCDSATLIVVLETMEFPSLPDLISKGAWEDVEEVFDAHKAVAESSGTTPWFLSSEGALAEPEHSIASLIAQAVVETTDTIAKTLGLHALSELQELGLTLEKPVKMTEAHATLRAHGLDNLVLLPKSHPRWYFEAVKYPGDTKQDTLCVQEGGVWRQQYIARSATALEEWWQKGCVAEMTVEVDNHNETGGVMKYKVWRDASGQMFQQPLPNQGMSGRVRSVWRNGLTTGPPAQASAQSPECTVQ